MAQVIITNEQALASTLTTIELDGVLRAKPIKTINSAVQTDTSATTVATAVDVVSVAPASGSQIQLVDENTVKVYLAAELVYTDMIIMDVEFEDELIRT